MLLHILSGKAFERGEKVLGQKFGVFSQGKKRFWIAILSAICFFCVGLICLVSSRREAIDVDTALVLNNIDVAGDTNNVVIVISDTTFSGNSMHIEVKKNEVFNISNCEFFGGTVEVEDGDLNVNETSFDGTVINANGTGDNNTINFSFCTFDGNGSSGQGSLGRATNGFGTINFDLGTTCSNFGDGSFDHVFNYDSGVVVNKWYNLDCLVDGNVLKTFTFMSYDDVTPSVMTLKSLNTCSGWFSTSNYSHVLDSNFEPASEIFPGEKDSVYTRTSSNSSNFVFSELGNGYSVSASSSFSVSGTLVFPAQYNNKPVHTIANEGFANKSNVTNIVLSSEIQTIEATAFDLTNISNLVISNKITSISNNVPFGRVLSTIVVDESNTVFDSRGNCNAIMETGTHTLLVGCKNTVIPETAKIIGFSAFAYRSGMGAIATKNVETIEDYAFYASSITSIDLENVITVKTYAFYSCTSLKTVVVGPKVETIGNSSFTEDAAITSLVFEKNSSTGLSALTSIGDYAFQRCKSIPQVSIPCTVTTLGVSAFNTCEALKTVTFEKNSSTGKASLATIGSYAFKKCYVLESVTIPDSVTAINKEAFHSCSGLKTLIVGSGVKTIGANAFYGCSAITRVEFVSLNDWDNVELSDEYSNPMFPVQGETTIFNNTEIVSGVYLTIARAEIKQYTYAGFDALHDVRIDTAVQTIGVGAFLGCSGLNVVYATSNWLEIEFADWSSNPLAEANTKKLMIYYWSKGNQYLGDPTGKFSYYSDNTFDLNITNIGAVNPYAFYGCENIKRVLCGYQSDYVEIGNYAFAYSSVEELFLMNANWNLNSMAFKELVSSEFKCFLEMSLDETTPIDGYFGNIAGALAEIFPNSLATTICFNSNDCGTEAGVLLAEMYAYYDMKISFFTGEGDNDFYFDGYCIYADGIESRYRAGYETLAVPGYYLYADASWAPVEAVMRGNNYNLYRLFIGEGVKEVYSGAFSDYDGLGLIILPETLEGIGDYAFASRYYEHIFVPESVYYIGEHAFGSGSSGITVYFPNQFFEKFDDEEFVNEHGSFEECFPEFPDDNWYYGEGWCDYLPDRQTYFRLYYFG